MAKNQVIIYGRHAVLAAMANPERQITKLMITRENLDEIRGKIADNKIFVVDRKEIDRLFLGEAIHQGFALMSSQLPNYALEEICEMAEEKENCHVLILDQVTDPQNIGAIIRSCAAFDALALIMQDKNSPEETGALLKAAAGTYEFLPICRVTNLSRSIDRLKKAGFWIIGMDVYAKTDVGEMAKDGKNAVIMGSEGKGMRRLVEESCDMTIRLPISSQVESLNVSTATAIVLYEMNKK
jgi:23S rRNA (guanosine2251-2'-O)-methyltransferase